jgi:hypothetical protein
MMKQILQEWFNEQNVSDEMCWKLRFVNQIMFVRDKIGGLVTRERDKVFVISTHTSKSIRLPVYFMERNGLQIALRDNFHNWKMSVISDRPIMANFDGIFHTTPPLDPDYTGNPLNSVYFEGFPKDLIFGYYWESDKKKWSAEIHSDYLLYTSIFLILQARWEIEPLAWSVRENME